MRRSDTAIASLALLIVWQAAALLLHNPILPGPLQVLLAVVRLAPGALGRHFVASAARVLVSTAIAVGLATPLGLAAGQSAGLNRLISPIVYVLYPIPKIVFLPIIVLLLGIGDLPKVVIITLILFFQVLVVVRDQAASIRPELLLSVRSLGAGRLAMLRFVYLPATLPAVLTSLRLSVGTAVAVLFFAESFATTSGLGYYIFVETWTRLAYVDMYAGVVAMSVLGLGLYFAIDGLERLLCPYLFLE